MIDTNCMEDYSWSSSHIWKQKLSPLDFKYWVSKMFKIFG